MEKSIVYVCLVLAICLGTGCGSKKVIPPNITAPQLYDSMVTNRHLKEHPKGENFCWNAAWGMDRYLNAYAATGDTSWVSWGIKYCQFLLDHMDTAPDGYKGWIGPYMYDSTVWCDVHVGDAILLTNILDFSVLILEDLSLEKIYGTAAREYVEIAKKHFVEKWDKRDTWREDGPYGGYISYNRYLTPDNLREWKNLDKKVRNSDLSLPFNKQNDCALVCLRLWRITGEERYRDKAERMFFRMKSRFQYFDDHYVWNYWEPFGPWDVRLEADSTSHWVGVHGYRDYQAGEVGQIVEAYHHGLVFDETDIRRIINTNLKVMWNGDREKPKFVNSNNTYIPRTSDKVPEGWEGLAGTLWSSLMDFDQTVRDLYARRFKSGGSRSIDRIYYENVVLKEPPGFKRKHVKGQVTVPTVEFTECPHLNLTVALPCVFKQGGRTILVCKAWKEKGPLAIDLYSKDGKSLVQKLHTGELVGNPDGLIGLYIHVWDGRDPEKKEDFKGDYRIRWTFLGRYREVPITIQ